jgi:hypothetical protein
LSGICGTDLTETVSNFFRGVKRAAGDGIKQGNKQIRKNQAEAARSKTQKGLENNAEEMKYFLMNHVFEVGEKFASSTVQSSMFSALEDVTLVKYTLKNEDIHYIGYSNDRKSSHKVSAKLAQTVTDWHKTN